MAMSPPETAFTSEAAYAAFQEDKIGKVLAGYLADFVVLDKNIFEVPSIEIQDIKVLRTYISGEIVYSAST